MCLKQGYTLACSLHVCVDFHSPKTCMCRSIGDSQLPLGVIVRVRRVWAYSLPSLCALGLLGTKCVRLWMDV